MKTVPELASRWLKLHPDALTRAQRNVLERMAERQPVARDISAAYQNRLSYGDRLADAMARTGGSWGFIGGFLLFLVLWTLGNLWLAGRAFDPYPFIFLNLVLSTLAAIQAPVILMSQNRQTEHDRIDAAHDYEVNLKAEIEIMALHDKLDQLRNEQIMALLERIEAVAEEVRRLEVFERARGTAGPDISGG
ncbi:DUF1003 domain-containing protein [Paracoccus sp. S-4012]|uniref:DUF1003 domain-containing protein n=1 Tax=Paracoccus sp. S-4012 TaxID=2665648 RepID=UPI0012B0E922|nr:DUF1003 domain-containing protein [Paracoccus sp. S-4012]MRX50055.1 DUF1003 domain-containing protein [Paracoccus sp. S-4012]